jgi:hypothetical protein
MVIDLKVNLDENAGTYYDVKAILVGSNRAAYMDMDANDVLIIESIICVNGRYETDKDGSVCEINVQDPSIIDRIGSMSAMDLLEIII